MSDYTDIFGACPQCRSKKSQIMWGWHGVYYDMQCENGHPWIYDFGQRNRAAVRLAKEKTQNDPRYFSDGFSIMKQFQEKETGRKRSPSFEGGFDIMKTWQRRNKEPQKKEKRDYFTGGFGILKDWQRQQKKRP